MRRLATPCAVTGLQKAHATQRKCAYGEELRKLKLWDDAKKEYEAALMSTPQSRCATNGLQEILKARAEAKQLAAQAEEQARSANSQDMARASIAKALATDSSVPIPELLKKLDEADRQLEAASAMERLGLHDKALSAIGSALEKYPVPRDPAAKPNDWQNVVPGTTEREWSRVERGWSLVVRGSTGVMTAIGEGILLIIASLALFSLSRKWRTLYRTLFPVATVNVGSFNLTPGPGSVDALRALIEMDLCRLQEAPKGFDLKMVRGEQPADETVTTAVSALAATQLQWLGTVLRPILGLVAPPALAVDGQAYLPADDLWPDATLTVRLTRGTDIVASELLRLRDFGWREEKKETGGKEAQRQRDLNQLALVAAVWTHFKVQEVIGKTTAYCGTTRWRSWAYFQSALYARTNPDIAVRYYLQAIDVDPQNRAARVNLAKVLFDIDRDKYLKEAIAHVEKVLEFYGREDPDFWTEKGNVEDYRRSGQPRIDTERTPYVAKLLSAIFAYESCKGDTEAKAMASKTINQLLSRIKGLLYKKPHEENDSAANCSLKPDFRDYLSSLQNHVQLISIGFSAAPSLADVESIDRIAKAREAAADYVLDYNLACSYALLAKHLPSAKRLPTDALGHLHRCFWLLQKTGRQELLESVVRYAKDDRTLDMRFSAQEDKLNELLTEFGTPPMAVHVSTLAQPDRAVDIPVKANHTAAERLVVSAAVVDPSKGTVTVVDDSKLTFTPASGISGDVTITYTLTRSDTGTVTVRIPA